MQAHVKPEPDPGPSSLHCAQPKGALVLGLMSRGEPSRGSRSPCPEWWVAEANLRLERAGRTKRTLARALAARGISEMMVLRCLHENPVKRVATTEAIAAISDALRIPRPVVVATSIEQARELEALVALGEIDTRALALHDDVSDDRRDARSDEERDGGTKDAEEVDRSRPRTASLRSSTVRRAPRSR